MQLEAAGTLDAVFIVISILLLILSESLALDPERGTSRWKSRQRFSPNPASVRLDK
jgi:hypothetical protein